MDYTELRVRRVEPIEGPDGLKNYRLTIEPEEIDPNQFYGSQLVGDVFVPETPGTFPEPVQGEVWIDGHTGDPEDPTSATLIGQRVGKYGLRSARLMEFPQANDIESTDSAV